jgi:hypothetical protein
MENKRVSTSYDRNGDMTAYFEETSEVYPGVMTKTGDVFWSAVYNEKHQVLSYEQTKNVVSITERMLFMRRV